MSGETGKHNVAKILPKGPYVVSSKAKGGWIDGEGKIHKINASPKDTQFYTFDEASKDGFSPTDVQKIALREATPEVKKPEEVKK